MGFHPLPALLLLQDAAATASDVHIIMYCEVVLTVIVVLLLLGIAIGALVIYAKIKTLTATVNAKSQPLIARGTEIAGTVNGILADLKPKIAIATDNVNEVIADLKPKIATVSADLQPKIASVTSDVQHISALFRSKADEAGSTFTQVNQTVQQYTETAQEANQKAKGQVARVNEMVSEALTTTQHVSKQIQHGIRVPVERVAGWVTAAKGGIEGLAEKLPFFGQTSGPRPGGKAPRAASGPQAVVRPMPATGSSTETTTGSAGPRVVHSAADYSTHES